MAQPEIRIGARLYLRFRIEANPPGFNIRAEFRTETSGWRGVNEMPPEGRLYLGEIMRAWGEVHMR